MSGLPQHLLFTVLVIVVVFETRVLCAFCQKRKPCVGNSATFGSACKPCRCYRNTDPCDRGTGACPNNQCDYGYTGTNCSIECEPDRYGPNCDLRCHCRPKVKCDGRNGVCCDGHCAVSWDGPSCQIELPRLLRAPLVETTGCDNVTISWKEWNLNDQFSSKGSGPIKEYVACIRVNGTTEGKCNLNESIPHTNTSTTRFFQFFNLPEGRYQFTIRVVRAGVRNELGERIGPESVPSQEITVPCTSPGTTRSTTSTTEKPTRYYIESIFVRNISSDFLTISWTTTINVTKDFVNIKLVYGRLKTDSCPNPNVTSTEVNLIEYFDTSSYTMDKLEAWATYNVTLTAIVTSVSLNVTESVSKVFRTKPKKPVRAITNVVASEYSWNVINLKWSVKPCNFGAAFKEYDVQVRRVDTNETKFIKVSNNYTQILDLKPYTRYAFSISVVTELGKTEYGTEVIARTSEGIPSEPRITNLSSTTTSVKVQWDRPLETNGVLRQYKIIYISGNTSNTHWTGEIKTSAVLKDLPPDTLFSIKVYAQTGGGLGNASTVSTISTKLRLSGAPSLLRVLEANETCIRLHWDAPKANESPVLLYKGTYRLEKTLLMKETNTSVYTFNSSESERTKLLCFLQPSSLYTITVGAVGNAYNDETKDLRVWTKINKPEKPKDFRMLSVTNTTITVSLPAVTDLREPIQYYTIEVNEVKPKQTRSVLPGGYITAKLTSAYISKNKMFVVGNDKTFGGYRNSPLKPSTEYNIAFAVTREHNGITESAFALIRVKTSIATKVPLQREQNKTALIAILVILFVILMILFAIAIIYWYRKRKNKKNIYATFANKQSSAASQDEINCEKFWSQTTALSEDRFIVAGRIYLPEETTGFLKTQIPKQILPSRITFQKEFHSLPHSKRPATAATLPQNTILNRFDHLLPYDHSIVKLQPDEISDNTYINANYIDGVYRKHAYIAAQSPFDDNTVYEFWRLIYQKKIPVVVMITKIEEEQIIRCTQFWPDDMSVRTFKNLVLKVEYIEEFSNFDVRKISITGSQIKSIVTTVVLHYKAWPEHGVPDDPYTFLLFRDKVNTYVQQRSTVLVHCGTGVSRTAVFIAIDVLLEEYKKNGQISVYQFVKKMRENRVGMVRTFKQYLFIYSCIFEYFSAGKCTLTDKKMKEVFQKLHLKNFKTGRTYLKDQFLSLREFTPSLSRKQCKAASHNMVKNRYQEIIPPDAYRPYIDDSFYINAVMIDGYEKANAFILTQTPLESTISDFWHLVYWYKITTIIMMQTLSETDESQYWPNAKQSVSHPPYVIKSLSETDAQQGEKIEESLHYRTFQIYHTNQKSTGSTHEIRQFYWKGWSSCKFVPKSRLKFLDALEKITEWQKMSCVDHSPILIHCSDGATYSGLICAVSILCNTMQHENEVDIFHTVKSIKRRRPHVINYIEQYRFLFKILWDFLHVKMPAPLGYDNKAFTSSSLSLYFDLDYDYNDNIKSDFFMELHAEDA